MNEEVHAEGSLQERVEAEQYKKFGTFGGVFRPTVMTIVGVIMFVREGWVIGNAGLLGGWLIICLAFAIVTATALSMSCITTNLRIGAGGAYSIISQSLGLEVGGSVGIPLYLAQALAGTMYIFGFREGLIWIFPEQSPLLLDLASFALMFGIAYISTGFAFKIQYLVLAVIIAGLVSFIGVVFVEGSLAHDPVWWGDFPGAPETNFEGADFWVVFAVFFPAATGIMAGANLSGDLKNPRRSIPIGTLSAIAVSFVIYMGLAYILARVASVDELVNNYTIMIDKAVWPELVLGALLGATFSSALAVLVGAPRILQALGDHRIFPGGEWFGARTKKGEPRNALLLTAVIVLGGILVRDLNAIAPAITMFFLITYMMINFVVLVEQSLNMVSFRPVFPIPRWVPLVGTAGCLFTMFIISPTVGIISISVVFGTYMWLTRRRLRTPHGDIRSGLFVALAEWAAKHTYDLPTSNERAWKPNLLVPFGDRRELRGTFQLIRDLSFPKGSVTLMAIAEDEEKAKSLESAESTLGYAFIEEGVFTRWALVYSEQFYVSIMTGLQTLAGTFFRPNVLFLRLPDEYDEEDQAAVSRVVDHALRERVGVQMFVDEPVAGLGQRQEINVWVRDQGPDWELQWDLGNIDLALLTAYHLQQNWNGRVRLITAVDAEEHVEDAREFLQNLLALARLTDVEIVVETGDFMSAVERAPQADIDLFGLPDDVDFAFMERMVDARQAACLFVADSGDENVLA